MRVCTGMRYLRQKKGKGKKGERKRKREKERKKERGDDRADGPGFFFLKKGGEHKTIE